MQYASETTVSVAKSRAEIEDTVTRYGAHGFISGWSNSNNPEIKSFAQVAFEMRDRQIRFMLPLPDKKSRKFTHFRRRRSSLDIPCSAEKTEQLYEQACRQRWRALLLVIKAKLEAIQSQISTFDGEFMQNIVMPDGMTIGEKMLDNKGVLLPSVISTGALPPLLPNYGAQQ